MKKLLYLAGLVLALGLFSSCNKDDDNGGTKGSIIGSWHVQKMSVKYYENGKLVEEEEEYLDADDQMIWTFNEDGTIEARMGDMYERENYSVKGSTLTIIIDEEESVEYIIHSVTSNELVIKTIEEGYEDGSYAEGLIHFRKVK